MPGARSARGLACSKKTRELVTTVTPETPGIPRAMVLTVSFALSPVTGLVCHRHRQSCFCQLDTSVGASGPHDFAVRKPAPSSEAPPASTASRLTSVTIAKRPSEERDGQGYATDLGQARNGKFFDMGLDHPNHLDPLQQNSVLRKSRPVEHFRAKACPALDKRSTIAGTVNWIKCTGLHPDK